MTIYAAIELIKWLALFALSAASICYQLNAKIGFNVAKLIGEAENIYNQSAKCGDEKFEWVIETLFEMVPMPLKLLIARQILEGLVQNTFEAMQQYAATQIERRSDRQNTKQEN